MVCRQRGARFPLPAPHLICFLALLQNSCVANVSGWVSSHCTEVIRPLYLTPLRRCQKFSPWFLCLILRLYNSRDEHHRDLKNGLNYAGHLYHLQFHFQHTIPNYSKHTANAVKIYTSGQKKWAQNVWPGLYIICICLFYNPCLLVVMPQSVGNCDPSQAR